MSDEISTQDLVAGAQAGADDSREALFRRFLPRVARMVAARLGVPRDRLPVSAEDVAQDALLRALRGLPQFESRGSGAFAAWLATIVENCIRNQLRSARGGGERLFWQRYGDLDLGDSFFPGESASPSGLAAGREANRAIEAAMLRLPVIYRQLLSLRFFAGMSHAEVAQEVGHTEVNCRKLVQRALDLLRVEIARSRDG